MVTRLARSRTRLVKARARSLTIAILKSIALKTLLRSKSFRSMTLPKSEVF